jgi:hypothetical protein
MFFVSSASADQGQYPSRWWKKIEEVKKFGSWEILPHEAKQGEVILSKRNELGIFSNLTFAPFILDGIRYASVEGLWQSLKYPDPLLVNDPRNSWDYPATRAQVRLSFGFWSKGLGDAANKLMKENQYKDVSYQGLPFDYKDKAMGSEFHYQMIKNAIQAKVDQNPAIKALLIKTKGLILRPDHKMRSNSPAAYYYYDILMEIRDNILTK